MRSRRTFEHYSRPWWCRSGCHRFHVTYRQTCRSRRDQRAIRRFIAERDRLAGNPDKDGAAVGDRVRVTLEGELVAFDADLGHWTLRGCSVPDRHVTWDYTLHWGTTFTPISSPISDSGGTQ